ncbi:ABC transporter permease [Bacteroidia bacterium]|nr:ABC transporter permease [Bacteroidia bacterium]
MKNLFKMGGSLDKRTDMIMTIAGALLLLLTWYALTATGTIIPPKILPSPFKVFSSFGVLVTKHQLFSNIFYTVKLNLLGYIYALIIAVPLGFLIGLFPLPHAMFQKYVEAIRYLPIPCISGIFIATLGLGFTMKASFLAFGLLIYVLPVIVLRISELQNPSNDKDFVYLQTIKTLGATNWQKFREVYWPYVMGKVFNDIINLTAISYTYVVIAEVLNKEGGIGASIATLTRQSLIAEVYGLLFVIILIGILQDYLLKKLDELLFPYKYN